jgi:CYTH domain-containing protein
MKKEIERRFLLKSIPIPNTDSKLSEIQQIHQYYYLVDDIWNRVRKIESSVNGDSYLHTIKTYIDGITYEEERNITADEFRNIYKDMNNGKYESKFLDKTRYIFSTSITEDFGDNEIKTLKWEVDAFNFSLIIAEIEIPETNYQLEIPNFMKKQILCEVTGIQELSNKNLASKLPNKL